MNQFIKFHVLALTAMSMTFISCSDEKDEPTPDTPTEPKVENVFTNGVPSSINGANITTNNNGQVTKIVDGNETITIEYGAFSRADNFNVKATIKDDYDTETFYMQTNKQGFATYVLQVYSDPTAGENEDGTDTWRFEYSSDGQLTRLQRSESGDDFTITYVNGDIVKVVHVDNDNDRNEYTINYTGGKPNKGCVMMFDGFFGIDMDEMDIFYYAGLLGNATKNLPVGYVEKNKDGDTYTETFHWEFDANDFPTKFWSGDNVWDAVTWSWN
ncbi:DUF4595 domain-containing protein [Muribaculum sp.]|uniref:DUF4595 domain-containing protein n=1 Tax=Muribaculum sp. TaxID=1918611 RepID=UPI0023D3AF01|nr:DUF4595 domain-containing protein [Muribaculum sp.]MDE5705160.1 DUF4595 domain-containing protein [Muribaculum sp.]